jgi:UDP-2,3-diacylglucosamine pyrophosphatase LpxH
MADATKLAQKLKPPHNFGGKGPDWLDHPEPRSFRPKLRFRTVWISDIHLGTAGCNAGLLVDFLASIECETLYLVGDIIDGWRLRKGWFWPDEHNEVIRRLLKMVHRGTRVVYVPGNHDEMMRDYGGLTFGGIEVALEAIHETADGRKLLVTHGDAFDGIAPCQCLVQCRPALDEAALLVAVRLSQKAREKCSSICRAIRGSRGSCRE